MRQLLTVQQTILAGGTCSVSDLTAFLAVTKASFEKDLEDLHYFETFWTGLSAYL